MPANRYFVTFGMTCAPSSYSYSVLTTQGQGKAVVIACLRLATQRDLGEVYSVDVVPDAWYHADADGVPVTHPDDLADRHEW
jgi:hypothetical protein